MRITELPEEQWNAMMRAKRNADMSNCYSHKIGAVLVTAWGETVDGYNHCPVFECKDLYDLDERRCPWRDEGAGKGSGLKMEMCPAIHAETSVILKAAREGKCTQGATLFAYCGIPCKDCMKELIGAGVCRIVCLEKDDFERDKVTPYNFRLSEKLAYGAGIELIEVEL